MSNKSSDIVMHDNDWPRAGHHALADIEKALIEFRNRGKSRAQQPQVSGENAFDGVNHLVRQMANDVAQQTDKIDNIRFSDQNERVYKHLKSILMDLNALQDEIETYGYRNIETELKSLRLELAQILPTLENKPFNPSVAPLLLDVSDIMAHLSSVSMAQTQQELHQPIQTHKSSLHGQLDAIISTLDTLPDTHHFRSLDHQLQLLNHSIDHLHDQHLENQPDLFFIIEERLDEISRAISVLSGYEHDPIPDMHYLERIEARISSLSRQIVELIEDLPNRTSKKLDALSNQIEHLVHRIDEPDQAIRGMAHDVAAIHDRLKTNADTFDTQQLSRDLDQRFDQLANIFAAQNSNLLDSKHDILHTLETRLTDVAQRLEASEDIVPASVLLTNLDQRFEALSAQINDISSAHEGTALHHIGSRLDALNNIHFRPNPGLSFEQVAPRLDQIERSISEGRANLLETAQHAAETALRNFLSENSDPLDQRLKNEIIKLESLTHQSAARNSKTFEAIHDSLLKIVDRISVIETQRASGSHSHPTASHHDKQPNAVRASISPAPQTSSPQTKRSDVSSSLLDYKAPDRNPGQSHKSIFSQLFSRDRNPKATHNSPQWEELSIDDAEALFKERIERDYQRGNSGTSVHEDHNTSADIIHAARIASRLTIADSANSKSSAQPRKRSLSAFIARRKKSIISALGSTALIAGGLQLFDLNSQVISNEVAVNKPASPAKTEALANPDPIKTSAISSPRLTSSEDLEKPIVIAAHMPDLTVDIPADIEPKALRLSALSKDPMALFEIGNRYGEARGTDSDLVAAARWYELAAQLGYPVAQYRIGNMYERGIGVERDYGKAKTWYEKAANSGNANAMHNLGVLLAMGVNGPSEDKAAIRWFSEAAALDITDSQYNLGILAAKGQGMPNDLTEAYKWLDIVARKGDDDAALKRDELIAAMNTADLEKARGKSILWKARSMDEAANIFILPDEWKGDTQTSDPAETKKTVSNIQLLLNEIGFEAGPADGVLGLKTRAAIKSFQIENKMEPTGDITDQLIKRLMEQRKTAKSLGFLAQPNIFSPSLNFYI